MRPIHLGFAALVLLALVAGLWAFLDAPSSEVRAALAREAAGARDGGSAILGDADSGGAGSGTAPEQGRTPLAAALEPGPDAQAAKKKGDHPLVRGRVVGPDGAGVAGAMVLAAGEGSWIRIPLDAEPDGIPKGWLEVLRTTTDAEGRFEFDKLRPGALRLAVRATGFAPCYAEDLQVPDESEHALPDLRLERGIVLQGQVVDRDGRGVPGASLLAALDAPVVGKGAPVALPGRGVPLATTASDGTFRIDQLAPGPWRLIVDSPAHLVHEEEGRTERAGEERTGLVFRVESGAEIGGRIKIAEGGLPAGLRVSARPSQEREPGAPETEPEAPSNAGRARHGLVDGEGGFVVRGLKPGGRFRLVAWMKSDDPGGWKRAPGIDAVLAFAGQRGVEMGHSPEAALLLRVVDARTGAPLTHFVVFAGVGRERALRDEKGEPKLEHAEGRARFGELRPAGGKPVHLRVAATGYADHERKTIVLSPGQTLDLGDVKLEPERGVTVLVVDAATREPVGNARVFMGVKTDEELARYLSSPADQDGWGEPGVRYGRTGADGRARFSSLPGRMVGLRARAKGYLSSAVVRRTLPPAEDCAVELELRRGGAVVVRVGDGENRTVQGVGIGHRPPDAGAQPDGFGFEGVAQKTGERGEARFDALEPGVHAFRVHDQKGEDVWFDPDQAQVSQGWVETVVAEGSQATLDFVVPPRGGLSGRVREAGALLEGARLRLVEVERVAGEHSWSGPDDALATSTDHEGRYTYSGLKCGGYELFVSHASRRMSARFPVTVSGDGRAFDVDLDVASIEGRVTDTQGNPRAGIDVEASPVQGEEGDEQPWHAVVAEDDRGGVRVNYAQSARKSERTDASGRYFLRGLANGVPLVVRASGQTVQNGVSAEITLAADEAKRGVDFALGDAGVIAIQLVGLPAGQSGDYRWYMVRATRVEEGGAKGASHTQWLGTWNREAEIRSLAPGKYQVFLSAQGRPKTEGSEQTVDVEAGKTTSVVFQAL